MDHSVGKFILLTVCLGVMCPIIFLTQILQPNCIKNHILCLLFSKATIFSKEQNFTLNKNTKNFYIKNLLKSSNGFEQKVIQNMIPYTSWMQKIDILFVLEILRVILLPRTLRYLRGISTSFERKDDNQISKQPFARTAICKATIYEDSLYFYVPYPCH